MATKIDISSDLAVQEFLRRKWPGAKVQTRKQDDGQYLAEAVDHEGHFLASGEGHEEGTARSILASVLYRHMGVR